MIKEEIPMPDAIEFIFFDNSDVFLSNKRFTFKGLKRNSKILQNYEILPTDINNAYKKPEATKTFLLFPVLIGWVFLSAILSFVLWTFVAYLISSIVFILIVGLVDKKTKESNKNTINVETILNGDHQLYTIVLPNSMDAENTIEILNRFAQERRQNIKKEEEIKRQNMRIIQEERKIKEKEKELIKLEREKEKELIKLEREKEKELINERYQKKVLLELERKKVEAERELRIKLEAIRKNILEKYTEYSDGTFKIENHKDFLKIVELNQDKIIEIDQKYIRDFLRFAKILEELFNKINFYFVEFNNSESYIDSVNLKKNIDTYVNIYKSTLALGLTMLSALISKNLVAFYQVYEQFDSSGVFDSHHEIKIQKTLSEINYNIKDLGNNIEDLGNKLDNKLENIGRKVEKITYAVYEMGYLNANKMDILLDTVITTELNRVNSSIRYRNLITEIAPLVAFIGAYKLMGLVSPGKK